MIDCVDTVKTTRGLRLASGAAREPIGYGLAVDVGSSSIVAAVSRPRLVLVKGEESAAGGSPTGRVSTTTALRPHRLRWEHMPEIAHLGSGTATRDRHNPGRGPRP